MTEQDINITKDATILYQFDEENFNNKRNLLEDLSTNNYHADAQGGPNIGTRGPGSFGAVSYDDGGDDRFIGPTLTDPWTTEFTCISALKVSSDSNSGSVVAEFDSFDIFLHRIESGTGTSEVMWDIVFDDGTETGEVELFELLDEGWVWTAVTYDATRDPPLKYFKDGEVVETRSVGADTQINQQGSSNIIFLRDSYRGPHECAFLGLWSRTLADSEVEYIHNLSGPVRGDI